ncbi:hypothetical protein KXD40_005729 [Peronospora effusa]|uniref:Uncharacterized protein n=1 Tax=Peronospora effusa TaxID=542832 RepID=A0A3M6V7Q2_9STRA|nr:hypothetical protein DD238_008087 [Peronospora effusa]RQM11761.1 hypothetical protein DD237_008169 [Peronospora effusa]UIZ27451.1 hypothetical protein KXD40_005729 [Peronospora effusa]
MLHVCFELEYSFHVKQRVRKYKEDIKELRIEVEDLERDMEECMLNETMILKLIGWHEQCYFC